MTTEYYAYRINQFDAMYGYIRDTKLYYEKTYNSYKLKNLFKFNFEYISISKKLFYIAKA